MSDAHAQLWLLLRDTSRSFYLTLRLLPGRVRPQIGLAYLLARTTDTVADTDLVSVERRLEALALLRERVLGRSSSPLDFRLFLVGDDGEPNQGPDVAERRLLLRCEDAIAALRAFSKEDQRQIETVIDVITSGQELDLRRFGDATPGTIHSLQTAEELDDYTYRVAGCVGTFWTQMCEAHLFGASGWNAQAQRRDGLRFGKGLQLVNILRDLPRDLRQGRCYLPAKSLLLASLTPEALLDPSRMADFRPVYDTFLALADSHLQAGWQYTLRIPRRALRLRMACALPILLGVRTLERLRTGHPLDPEVRIKVSRVEVRRAIGRALAAAFGLQSWDAVKRWASR